MVNRAKASCLLVTMPLSLFATGYGLVSTGNFRIGGHRPIVDIPNRCLERQELLIQYLYVNTKLKSQVRQRKGWPNSLRGKVLSNRNRNEKLS
jgi:hypothetical protein